MARLNTVKACRKAQGICGKCMAEIKVGDGYVWWQFYNGPINKRCMKPACQPTAQDLTSSAFDREVITIGEALNAIGEPADAEEIIGMIEDLGSQCQESLDNMPESLQENSSSGELLRERIDACEQWADEVRSAKDEADGDWDQEEGETEEALAERREEKLQAIKDCGYGG